MQLGDHAAARAKDAGVRRTRCREHGDTYILAHNLFWLGVAAMQRGDMTEAEKALLEALTAQAELRRQGYGDDAVD